MSLLVSLRKRILRVLGYSILKELRPLFLEEKPELKTCLTQYHFHPAVVAHPKILFTSNIEIAKSGRRVLFLERKVSILWQTFNLTVLSTSNTKKYLQKLGVNPYYCHATTLALENSDDDYRAYPVAKSAAKQDRIAVYSVITGNYDTVLDPLYVDQYTDYFLFTNNPSIKSEVWNVILIKEDLPNTLLSRKIKLFPNLYLDQKYDVSIYIDASFNIYGPLRELAYFLNNNTSLVLTKHSVRNKVSEELEILASSPRYSQNDKGAMRTQYQHYLDHGFTDTIGLTENGILIRKHKDAALQKVMQYWWEELQKWICRDQLSLMPSLQINNYHDYIVLDANISNNQYAILLGHKQQIR